MKNKKYLVLIACITVTSMTSFCSKGPELDFWNNPDMSFEKILTYEPLTTFCPLSYWQRFKNWIRGTQISEIESNFEKNLTYEEFKQQWKFLKDQNDLWYDKDISMSTKIEKLLKQMPRDSLIKDLNAVLFPSKSELQKQWAIDFINKLNKENRQFLKLKLLHRSPSYNYGKSTDQGKEYICLNFFPELKKIFQIELKRALLLLEISNSRDVVPESVYQQINILEKQAKNLHLLSIIKRLLQERDTYLESDDPKSYIKVDAITDVIDALLAFTHDVWLSDATIGKKKFERQSH